MAERAGQYTFGEVKELSVKKWTFLRDHADLEYGSDVIDALIDEWKEIRLLLNQCGFCEMYVRQLGDEKRCPLYSDKNFDYPIDCCYEYNMWARADNRNDPKGRTYWADRMLKRIERAEERA